MSSRVGWNGFTGRIWPAGRSLEATGLTYAMHVFVKSEIGNLIEKLDFNAFFLLQRNL